MSNHLSNSSLHIFFSAEMAFGRLTKKITCALALYRNLMKLVWRGKKRQAKEMPPTKSFQRVHRSRFRTVIC